MDTSLPAPKNGLVDAIKIALDKLVEGVGVEVAIAAATAYLPWLGAPVVRAIFRFIVQQAAKYLDEDGFLILAKLTIRFQGDSRKGDMDKSVEVIKKPGATPDEIEAAKRAIDALVNRNRP